MNSPLPPTIVCGIARNASGGLLATLRKLETLMLRVEEWTIVIVTNDNTDQTDLILAEWAATDKRHVLMTVNGLVNAYPDRVDRIAAARNLYLHYLNNNAINDFSLVMIMDLTDPT